MKPRKAHLNGIYSKTICTAREQIERTGFVAPFEEGQNYFLYDDTESNLETVIDTCREFFATDRRLP